MLRCWYWVLAISDSWPYIFHSVWVACDSISRINKIVRFSFYHCLILIVSLKRKYSLIVVRPLLFSTFITLLFVFLFLLMLASLVQVIGTHCKIMWFAFKFLWYVLITCSLIFKLVLLTQLGNHSLKLSSAILLSLNSLNPSKVGIYKV